MSHTNPFAPNPRSLCAALSTQELEDARVAHAGSAPSGITEELNRRGDVDRAVELWERLCAVPFVRGEAQGEFKHSTRHLTTGPVDRLRGVDRMPNREELEALILSDGEETAYPAHDVVEPSGYVWRQDTSPWSYGDRLYPVTLTLISCGDYHGSDLDAANNRTLKDVPGVDFREPNTGGQGSVFNVTATTVGQMSSFENATDPGDTDREPAERRADALMWLENLVKAMEGLTECGLLDDETHSEYLAELAEEAWSDHLEHDTFDMLQEIGPGGREAWEDMVDAPTAGPELKESVRDAYFGYDQNEWNAQSATSIVNGRHDDAVKHVARTVFGWNVP